MRRQALLLNAAEVARLLDTEQLLDVLAKGFETITDETAISPPRGEMAIGDAGHLLTMPAAVPGLPFGTKLVTLFPGNAAAGIPTHLGLIILMDSVTGEVLALMDGAHITAMRTAGAATLAAKLLARPDSRAMTILGAGVQGQAHLDLMSRHFDIETIYVGSHGAESAQRLAARDPRAIAIEDHEAAVRASDIVCLCSHAEHPLIHMDWLCPGQHISSVGYAPPCGELDPAIAARHRLVVEARIAFAPAPAGCAELAGIDPAWGTELGEILLGRKPGRESIDEVTVYKAMGHAVEDLVVADMVYRRAIALSAGQSITL
ncbi:ornithine cyclodeaminase family protein [Sphingomonas oryzagri]|uniref:Ornithine cyclodeaminase family protein n=1 Tax=Sphingomonas oryzagri TaxID=3042314 RepID=A0ABT6MXH0_9SPHN|nr:ornithine cyclodeaminase family protein [Sphingomonas oryzagri]MDH7637700.1 ornithine cyclodeaminase family protein [Sphingomonas oryzagri]